MHKIPSPTQLVEQVYESILDAICQGTLQPNERITQEGLAETLGVSRQPILQAFQLLKRQGFIEEAGRKGVIVTPLDPQRLVQLYQVRAALDALAARAAARRVYEEGAQAIEPEGRALIQAGRDAAARQDSAALLRLDMAFHQWLYQLSGNPVIAETTALHWQHIRRTMSSVLSHEVRTFDSVWDEHHAILQAVLAGDEEQAGFLAQQHAESAAEHLARILEGSEHASKRKQA